MKFNNIDEFKEFLWILGIKESLIGSENTFRNVYFEITDYDNSFFKLSVTVNNEDLGISFSYFSEFNLYKLAKKNNMNKNDYFMEISGSQFHLMELWKKYFNEFDYESQYKKSPL